MVVFNLSYTAPINPPGTKPVLTPDQVWEGLQYKVRRADQFVPIIADCEVVSDEPATAESNHGGAARVVTRLVTFMDGPGTFDKRVVREVCRLYPPCRIDFVQEDGSTVGNYVSPGPSGADADLYMTYVFEWRHPEVEEGSAEVNRLEEKYKRVAKMAVEGSINTIRKIATGEIKMEERQANAEGGAKQSPLSWVLTSGRNSAVSL